MQKGASPKSPKSDFVKLHVSFPREEWEALTAIAAVNKARGKKGDNFSALIAELGTKLLRKPESISALRAAGSPLADTFANK